MNGPACALVGFVVAVGVFMLVSAVVRHRRQRRFWTPRHTWAHVSLTALWLATIALIFITAEPGPQPKLSALVQAVTMTPAGLLARHAPSLIVRPAAMTLPIWPR